MKTSFNHSGNKSILTKSKFPLTSINTRKKILLRDPLDINMLSQTQRLTNEIKILDTRTTFPNLSSDISKLITNSKFYQNSSENINLNLEKIKYFIKPSHKCLVERNKISDLKKKLEKKRFRELHNYKLKINPDNFYHDYGLSNYIKIKSSSNFHNKTVDRYFNNISSYNYIKTEEKKEGNDLLSKNKIKIRRNNFARSVRLKNIPSKDIHKLNNFIFENFNN